MSSYENLCTWLTWHYARDAGDALLEGLGLVADELADYLRQALRSRLAPRAPLDALAEIAHTLNLSPPSDLMSEADLRAYLANPWILWAQAGTRERILAELTLLGLTSPQIVSWRDLADAGSPTAFGKDSSCWYLELGTGHPFTDAKAWDGGDTWDGGLLWDAQDPQNLMPRIERVIAKWKPASSSCRYIQFTLPSGTVLRRPVWEWWEITGGRGRNYYNDGY